MCHSAVAEGFNEPINKPNVMSQTGSDYDDEDLSAPPKKAKKSKNVSEAANRRNLDIPGDDDDTLDEELEQTFLVPPRSSVKRKQDDFSGEIPASAINTHEKDDGVSYLNCANEDGDKLVWLEAEEAAVATQERVKRRQISTLQKPTRQGRSRKPPSTGVGINPRGTRRRPKSRPLNLGISSEKARNLI